MILYAHYNPFNVRFIKQSPVENKTFLLKETLSKIFAIETRIQNLKALSNF